MATVIKTIEEYNKGGTRWTEERVVIQNDVTSWHLNVPEKETEYGKDRLEVVIDNETTMRVLTGKSIIKDDMDGKDIEITVTVIITVDGIVQLHS